ncbi:hypothetical protein QUF58_13225 [Anaerolineales bacterium HSG24]|nr:hypothetical protein [Anaerolineales bacterium HSG24]
MRGNRRVQILAISIVVILALCLIGYLVYSIVNSSPPEIATDPAAGEVTATETAEEEATTEADSSNDNDETEPEPTPTSTRVQADNDEADETDGNDEADENDDGNDETDDDSSDELDTPTATPSSTENESEDASDFKNAPSNTKIIYKTEQLLENGDFEAGFTETGVAESWQEFQNDGIVALFLAEETDYVGQGEQAQRFIMRDATQQDRYAGIYQQVEVVPDEVYTLSLNGFIRSAFGDIIASSYGYRMQYAIDDTGIDDWQSIPAENWVELPWDEAAFYMPPTELYTYTTEITPTSDSITLYIRAWNKWAVLGEAQYTLDNLTLTGPKKVWLVDADTNEEDNENEDEDDSSDDAADFAPSKGDESADGLLPVTGMISSPISQDNRLWSGLFVLMLLSIGVGYRLYRYR